MSTETNGVWSFGPDISVLDDLELLRNEVLGDGRVGPAELVQLEHNFPAGTTMARVSDPEGVPLAEVPVRPGRGEVLVAQGHPRWLGRRSARPFESLHHAPHDLGHSDVLVVIDATAPASELSSLDVADAGAVLVLILASTDGEEAPVELPSVRSAVQWATGHHGVGVVIAPLGRSASRRAEKKARIIEAYARGARIIDLTAPEPRPPEPHGGTVLFFTGLSGSGKSTIARAVRNRLIEAGQTVTLLDGDVVRRHLSAGLGFGPQDRHTNIRRIGWVAAEIAGHGGLAICSPIAPFEQSRQEVRQMVASRGGDFVLVHVSTPLEVCERRDRKGLYAQARRGEIADFTGISSPYEEPLDADLRINTTSTPLDVLRDRVLAILPGADAQD